MRRRKELTAGRIALWAVPPAVVLVSLAAALSALALWLHEPGYWRRNQERLAAVPREELQRQAEAAEASFAGWITGREGDGRQGQAAGDVLERLANALEGHHPLVVEGGAARTIELSGEQINAWLATSGQPLLDRHGLHTGGRIRDPMVAFEDGGMVMAFGVVRMGVAQVISLVSDVWLETPQKLRIKLREVRGGSLGVRSGGAADPLRLLEGELDEWQRGFLGRLREGITVEVGQVLEASDPQQRMVVGGLEIGDEKARITLAGERRSS